MAYRVECFLPGDGKSGRGRAYGHCEERWVDDRSMGEILDFLDKDKDHQHCAHGVKKMTPKMEQREKERLAAR